MLCSWWICPFFLFLLHYCEASHFDLRNYTFSEYYESECQASHSTDQVIWRNHQYANYACVHFEQKQ